MKSLLPVLLSAILLFTSQVYAQKGAWTDVYEPQTFHGLPVRVMKPIDFDPSKSYPVILSLHGAGGKGTNNDKQLKDWNKQLAEQDTRKEFPCYVVAPQAPGLWNAEQFETIKKLIAGLPSADKNRIYCMGHSMGGHGTYIYIQLAPDYFAAAAPSAGSGLKKSENFIDPSKFKDLPVWAFHGDKDGVCPIDKQNAVMAEMKKIGGNMKQTTWLGGNHGVSGKMIPGAENGKTTYSSDRCDKEPDFLTWLFKQKRSS